MAQLQDNQAARLNIALTDAYGETVEDTFSFSTDGAVGEEGAPLVSLVDVAEGEAIPAGTYVVAGDDVGGPTVVTATADNAKDADGNPITASQEFTIVASAAVSAAFGTDEAIEKSSIPVAPAPEG